MVADAKILSLDQENFRLKEDLHLQKQAFADVKGLLANTGVTTERKQTPKKRAGGTSTL
jgi:hypothetical protein